MVLIPESRNRRPKEIEQEILEEIRSGHFVIPWCKEVEKVRVVEDYKLPILKPSSHETLSRLSAEFC